MPIKNMVSFDLLLFTLKTEFTTRGTNSMPFLVFRWDHLRFSSGSFAVLIGGGGGGDHLRSNLRIISGLGIMCGQGSFAALYRSRNLLHACVERAKKLFRYFMCLLDHHGYFSPL